MEKQILETTPLAMRGDVLRNSCYKVLDNELYTRQLEADEVIEQKTELFNSSLEIEELEQELKATVKELKAKIKALKAERSELIKTLRFSAISQKGTLYLLDDQDAGLMGIYDATGRLVNVRPLTADERQTSFLTVKTGTNA